MRRDPIKRLLGRASAPLGVSRSGPIDLAGRHRDALGELLGRTNGFYAFESALHVFPAGAASGMSLERWNRADLWRSGYDGLADGLAFFAEDVFGGQFVLADGGVGTFDPETGDVELIADDLRSWAAAVLDDADVLTGYPLAHEWQVRNGPLPSGKRLVPKLPFVAGGDLAVANLWAADAVDGMRFRADLATQIRDLPDGTKITFRVDD